MKKLLKNLLLTTSIVLVTGVLMKVDNATAAGKGNVVRIGGKLYSLVGGDSSSLDKAADGIDALFELKDEAGNLMKDLPVGTKVKLSNGRTGVIQAGGKIKISGGGTGTGSGSGSLESSLKSFNKSDWKYDASSGNYTNVYDSKHTMSADAYSKMVKSSTGGGASTPSSTTTTTTPTESYTVDQLNGMGENSSLKIENETFTKQVGSKGPEWVDSSGKTYTPEQLSLASQNASNYKFSFTSDSLGDVTVKDGGVFDSMGNKIGTYDPATNTADISGAKQENFVPDSVRGTDASTNAKISGQKNEGDLKKGDDAVAEAEAAKGEASVWNHKASIQNVLQYALLITAAALADNDWTETQTVKVKGNLLEQTQGESGDGSVGSVSTLDGTTTADAAASMATLLANNAVNYDPLLSKEVDMSGLAEGLTGAGGTGSVVTSGTQYKKVIKRRRERLFQVYSTAASMIAAGSNAISSRFYDRLSLYIDGLMSTSGTLGALSTINDSERFVMFEMSRGAALSATELGFRGAGTLRELDVLEEESHGS